MSEKSAEITLRISAGPRLSSRPILAAPDSVPPVLTASRRS
ncbi:hypothetical protein ACIQZO_17315 [Streptomyces sp. NPDC097617]